VVVADPHVEYPEEAAKPRSQLSITWGYFLKERLAVAGGVIVLLAIVAAITAPWLSPYGVNESFPGLRLGDIGTPGHPLGLDSQGRDILTRLLWGARLSLLIAFLPVVIAASSALVLGLLAGFYGGWIGQAIMRFLDMLFAFPLLLLAIAIAGALGPGLLSIVISMSIVAMPYITRVVFYAVLEVKDRPFIEAARAAGAKPTRILFNHVLPNIAAPLVVYSMLNMAAMIIYGAGISFLGLGIQPPTADWGLMISDGRNVLAFAPHVSALPGAAIALMAIAFNLLGDGLLNALDPRLRVEW
jgi:ABC-type dipeptide/oligopeptide/nickel transport system permease subunit